MTRALSACLVGFTLALLAQGIATAQQVHSPSTQARYVTVNVEIHGLEESTRVLAGAAQALASTLEDVKSRKKDLTPEQIDRLAALAREMHELVRAAERTMQESNRAIEDARGPVKAMVADAMAAARETGVDPVLRSIHGYVTTWLVIAVLGGLVALALSLYVFFSIGRQLREMAAALKSIAAEYEIVRRTPRERADA
jgi:hypothetical protein